MSRAILIIAGPASDPRYEPGLYVQLRLLQELKCDVPVVLYGDESPDLACFRHEWRPMPVRPEPWATKAPIIRDCGFDDVIFMDADCYPVYDPAKAFDWPSYTGRAIFPLAPGPRGVVTRIRETSWRAFGHEPMLGPMLEPSFILLNPQKCKAHLDQVDAYGQRTDLRKFVSYGDCDWFQMGFAEDYDVLPDSDHLLHSNLIPDPDGKPFIVHRYADKFRLEACNYQSLQHGHFNTRHRALPNEDLCFDFFWEYAELVGFQGRLGGFPWDSKDGVSGVRSKTP